MINLKNVSTLDLIEELKTRESEVKYYINDRSSADCFITIDFQRTNHLMGEHIILACSGNWNG